MPMPAAMILRVSSPVSVSAGRIMNQLAANAISHNRIVEVTNGVPTRLILPTPAIPMPATQSTTSAGNTRRMCKRATSAVAPARCSFG